MKTANKPGDEVTCYGARPGSGLHDGVRYTVTDVIHVGPNDFFALRDMPGTYDVGRFCPIPVSEPLPPPTTIDLACAFLDEVKALLVEKNKAYGNSASEPVRIFSKTDTVEQLKVRIDDKLSRIARGAGLLGADEDVVKDLVGYLALLHAQLGVK